MSSQTPRNSQIADAVTRSGIEVTGEAPAMATGMNYQTMAHSTGSLFETAIVNAQRQDALGQAAWNLGAMQIYSLGTVADAATTSKIGQIGVADNLTGLQAVLQPFTG